MIGFADKELSTLVKAYYTGENIQGFPDTTVMIDRMGSAVVNRRLLVLDLNTNGSLDERRTGMSVAIGLEVSDV
ncbi:hypothetical protein DID88_004587 [Monilinia fructigena]|uniref:Uncharacterized protein n=1 Tax=Monilinia fructigena TaxID=38457 RepID=A0A395IQY7_9HELO|nr:hypothetical protein DID88_004587 [Monilinia fructigena]